jgi:D-3-phosphoglycerate dehydrogenase / 2-oxoglutarate reductase
MLVDSLGRTPLPLLPFACFASELRKKELQRLRLPAKMAALRRSCLMANARLKVAVIDDYQDAFRKLPSFARLSNHDVTIFNDTEKDAAKLALRL